MNAVPIGTIFRSLPCFLAGALLASCDPAGARMQVFRATVAGPVGGLVNVIRVVNQYPASPGQLEAARATGEKAAASLGPALRRSLARRKTTLISIPVPSGSGTGVMVYDTKTGQMASSRVFELDQLPEPDSFVEFSTYFSLYTRPKAEGDESSQRRKDRDEPVDRIVEREGPPGAVRTRPAKIRTTDRRFR